MNASIWGLVLNEILEGLNGGHNLYNFNNPEMTLIVLLTYHPQNEKKTISMQSKSSLQKAFYQIFGGG